MSNQGEHTMACMEVWGGNRETDIGVNMLGLDAWVYSKPFGDPTAGGGDVHYVTSCASGSITRLLLADVSGHGKVVADIADRLRGIMQKHVNRIDQGRVLAGINEQFQQHSADDSFATAILLTFFAPREELTLSNAGHPPPMVFRNETRTWEPLREARPAEEDLADVPLGIFEDVDYSKQKTRLRRGDMVLCYSDALIEAKARNGRQLGHEGLMQILRGLPTDEPDKLIRRLLDTLRAEARLDQDDLTAILVRRSDEPIRVPIGRLTAAPLRMLWAKLAPSIGAGRPRRSPPRVVGLS